MPLRADFDVAKFHASGGMHLPAHLGVRVIEVVEGRAVLAFDVRAELMAPNGYLHAGSLVTLADTAAGYGCIAHLPEGAQGFTTIELKANFMGTARSGIVRADARSVHLGRTTQIWDATCYAEGNERPIALFRCTQMVLWPQARS
jgi:1,4-dihydroxy-2-naphthoyl-CoA hydrolase